MLPDVLCMLANVLAGAPTRELIHPGVLQYMKEIGML